ncbi:RNase H domain protein [Nemania serpens]|nr:RNase H domain protein [Nemania serpens]
MNCKDDSEIPRPLVDAPKVEIENACQQSRGTGQVFPTEFTPRSALVKPTTLFRARAHGSGTRYIHQDDAEKQLIFTRGACLNNGQQNVKAGWAFVSGPGSHGGPPHTTSGRLETAGPFGEPSHQSIHRAELRAVIAALRSRAWNNDGVKTIVIATDSDYVTMGATMWAKSWIKKDWVKCGRPVKNRDLWEVLLGEAEELDEQGVSVQFWQIQRDWNTVADAAAKEAAAEDEAVGK